MPAPPQQTVFQLFQDVGDTRRDFSFGGDQTFRGKTNTGPRVGKFCGAKRPIGFLTQSGGSPS